MRLCYILLVVRVITLNVSVDKLDYIKLELLAFFILEKNKLEIVEHCVDSNLPTLLVAILCLSIVTFLLLYSQ
jgi:hypothetical protein